MSNKIVKPKPVPDENLKDVEEIIISPEKRKKYWTNEDKSYKKKHYKLSKLSNNSTVSRFATKRWTKLNYLSGDQYFANKKIRFKTPAIGSSLCDCNDAYTVANNCWRHQCK